MRKIPKEQLAMAVRKHFNNMAMNESEAVADFVYTTKAQGKSPDCCLVVNP